MWAIQVQTCGPYPIHFYFLFFFFLFLSLSSLLLNWPIRGLNFKNPHALSLSSSRIPQQPPPGASPATIAIFFLLSISTALHHSSTSSYSQTDTRMTSGLPTSSKQVATSLSPRCVTDEPKSQQDLPRVASVFGHISLSVHNFWPTWAFLEPPFKDLSSGTHLTR